MIDFRPVRDHTATLHDLARERGRAELIAATNAMYDEVEARLGQPADADVTFLPVDPGANDEFASDAAEVGLPWTLGHVIVHLTASAEEAAFISAELARGVAREGRSRSETEWTTVTTAAQVHARLVESRRMILAMLDVWPDAPDLETAIGSATGPRNAVVRFLSGLSHADSHLEQVSEIGRQAARARTTS